MTERSSHDRRWSTRAFRALLALYPTQFRDEYGRELALVFDDAYRRATSPWARARLWAGAFWGVFTEAPKEHVQMLGQDLRYALRTLVKNPLFATTVVATLALGIGANTAVFQLIDAIRLRSLPIERAHELAEIRIVGGNKGFGLNPGRYGGLTRPIWQELEAHQQAFSGLFAWSVHEVRVGEDHDLRRANAITVSGRFFDVLRVAPWRGRLFEPSDAASTCPATRGVVSHGYWQRELGGRPLGPTERLRINGESVEIVGVAPPRFTGVAVGDSFDVALPFCQPKEPLRRDVFNVAVMGRLRPGWTIDRASAHLDAMSTGVFEAVAPTGYSAKSIEAFKAFRLAAYAAPSGVSALRSQYDRSLWLLFAITGLVLLIACANLANLMLARAAARDREVSVRLALGASRPAIVRQLLAESACSRRSALRSASVSPGHSAGCSSGRWRRSRTRPRSSCTATGACSSSPASSPSRRVSCSAWRPSSAPRESRPSRPREVGARGATADRGRLFTQRVMVVAQIAVSLVLLVGALLFVRSFYNLMTFDPGIRQADISIGFFGFHKAKLPPDRINEFQRQLLAEVRSVPGIVSAASTTNVPLLGSSWTHGVTVDGVQDSAKFTWVSPGYFETVGTPLVQGRDFTFHDTRTSTRVAIVNRTFVRRFVPNGSALGRTLKTGAEPNYPETIYEIVGVIADTQYHDLRSEPPAMVFAPDSQFPPVAPWSTFMIRSSVEPASATASIKRRLAQSHPLLIMDFTGFQSRIRDGLVRERLMAMVSGFFGALAALVAMVGLYGMMSYAMAQRQQEIGIRVALGANRRRVVLMVMKEAAWLLLVGLAIGGTLSMLATRSAASLLFQLEPHDRNTLLTAGAALAAIAMLASFVPARRASRLDPIVALRQD